MNSILQNVSCVLLVILVCFQANAQDYTTSIVGTDFDIITDDDPSCFVALDYKGIQRTEMPDKTNNNELFQPAHVFIASYSDKTDVSIAVDVSIETEKAATAEALLLATRLGKLPIALRSGVRRLVVHEGGKDTTAFSDDGLIVIYSANAKQRISTNDLEETLFHESVHAAWDRKYATSRDWQRAQAADGTFATMYAKQKPALEDLAESALFAYAVIRHPDRLPAKDRKQIKRNIPARIRYIGRLLSLDEERP